MSRFGACSARISGDTHTDTQNDYRNPRCACTPRVNESTKVKNRQRIPCIKPIMRVMPSSIEVLHSQLSFPRWPAVSGHCYAGPQSVLAATLARSQFSLPRWPAVSCRCHAGPQSVVAATLARSQLSLPRWPAVSCRCHAGPQSVVAATLARSQLSLPRWPAVSCESRCSP